MIRALVTGTIYGDPQTRNGKSGQPFTTAKIKVDTTEGAIWVSLIAFGEQSEALAALPANAAVSVLGKATLTAWLDKTGEPRASLSLVVESLIGLAPPARKERKPRAPRKPQESRPAMDAPFDDSLDCLAV